ncbi:hypothetical protein [Porphyromonas macacae]|uniref:hypothetical protein n=1 Tax=Porphyromonas macacae TaxID=28115 RepID=UPI0024ACD54E|nr:hypothetical protein [Porphyromonas macacae]
MKKIVYLFFALMFITKTGYSQTKEERNVSQEVQTSQISNYELVPTNNVWVFLKLDTRNGKINQLHFSVDTDSYRGELVVNDEPLLPWTEVGKEKPGRFTLYPTQNTYNFILLDRINGRSWQVQWSLDKEKRFIIPIW